jgi:hypothetical protein
MERKRTAQFYRLWANYFAPVGNPEIFVKIPKKWSSFFLSNLLQPDSFNWSKSFLSSEIPPTLLEPELESLSIAIPKSCPNDKFLDKVLSEDPQNRISDLKDVDSSPSHPTIVDSDLRRSKRLKDSKASFRHGSCPKRNCLMCHHKFDGPPTLSTKVIRNLGAKFCSMSEEELTDKNLKKKNSTRSVCSKKPNKKDRNDNKEDSNDEDK